MKEKVKTNKKNMTITYKRNGYEVDAEMQGYHAWSSHLMGKVWYRGNTELQDTFDTHWHKLIGEWN